MDIPQVDSCCFGILPLKTGALVCGIVSLVAEVTLHGYVSYYGTNHTLNLLYQILIVCGIIGSILLIIGILMNNASLARFYIFVYALLVIASIILLIWYIVAKGKQTTEYVVDSIIYICIIGYCLIVVNSYYRSG